MNGLIQSRATGGTLWGDVRLKLLSFGWSRHILVLVPWLVTKPDDLFACVRAVLLVAVVVVVSFSFGVGGQR